jgi:hypothetical protein
VLAVPGFAFARTRHRVASAFGRDAALCVGLTFPVRTAGQRGIERLAPLPDAITSLALQAAWRS